MESASPAVRKAVSRWSTWEILAAPFLDTDMPEHLRAGSEELAARGVSGPRLFLMRLITAGGLWWNVLWWEWAVLDGCDILFGWMLNAVIVAAVAAAFWLNWAAGLAIFFALYPLARALTQFAFNVWTEHDA